MVEQKRTKLFLMLVQQAGAGSLPLSFLNRFQCLEFMRQAETVAANERSPVFVYWSSREATWLLPEFTANLERRADCLAVFSEDRDDKQEEFCFIVESHGLSLVIYGHHAEEHGADVFQCVGSVDPELVRQAFQMMLPMWQFLDLSETNRLEDARANANKPATTAQLLQNMRALWQVVKPSADFGAGTLGDTGERQAFHLDTGERPAVHIETSERPAYQPGPIAPGMRTAPVAPAAKSGRDADFNEADPSFVFGGLTATSERVGAPAMAAQAQRPQVVTAPQPKKEKPSKAAIRELRNREAGVWQPIPEQSREVFPPEAQRIIRDIMGRLRHSSDHFSILQFAIEELTKVAHADRGLVWQQIGDQLTVTNEFSPSGYTPFVGTKLGASESEKVISEFLVRFKDETGTGVIAIPDMSPETRSRLARTAPTLHALIEMVDVRARVVSQLRCIGRFHGFLELQQSTTREWSEEDATLLQSVAETLSIVTQQAYDLEMREMDASEMKLINMISELFRESKGQRIKDTLSRSVKLVAEHIGFVNAQVYLLNEEERLLIPQIASEEHGEPVSLDLEKNPFVQVCSTRKPRTISFELTGKRDPFFDHETALVVPLESEGETMGVVGFWKHAATSPRRFRPGDEPKLAQTVCNNLASIVRADQAIALIRADRSRSELINSVNDVIRQSPKDVEHILQELVSQLQQHFEFGLCVVSLYDANSNCFIKSKVSGDMAMPKGIGPDRFAEILFQSVLEEIMRIPLLEPPDLNERLQAAGITDPPKDVQLVTIVPAVHHEDLKAAICLVSAEGSHNLGVQDMNMIKALAERVAVDISHKELFEQVERQAITDPMTGLYNRRHFAEQLSKEIDRNQRFGHPFSYIILDLDYLKRINDSLGHQFGDNAIKHIANVTKKCVRDVDTTARYGGEEFVVLLPETDLQGARVVAERMCYAIRELPVEGIGTVTASIGVATFPYDAQDRDKLTELADQALYLAKHRGRNQVCSVSEDLIPSLDQLGEEALEIQKAAIKAKAEELASIDLRLVAEYGLLGILGGVMKLIEAKDQYANDRSPRAADYAGKLAQALHLSKDHTTVISLAAILHNIGKIGISEEILQKKDALTPEERKIVETSPAVGAKILEPAKHLHRVASVVESYHEHWDGTGYPRGLRGEQIPLESRIIALIDAYVAMTSDRPYRTALSPREAAQALQAGAGKEWDPRLVKLFLSVLSKDSK